MTGALDFPPRGPVDDWHAHLQITGTGKGAAGPTSHALSIRLSASTQALLKDRIINVLEQTAL